MISAQLQGRRLVLSVWENDENDTAPIVEPFLVDPMNGKTGRQLSQRYLFAIEGLAELIEEGSVADDMIAAFGRENAERADEELTTAEGELLMQAAYFWQSVGGMDAVRELLAVQDDGSQGGEAGMGKALAVFRLRMVPLLSQIRHRLESARQTAGESTPGTATPRGSSSSGEQQQPAPASEAPTSGPTSPTATSSGHPPA